MTFVQNIRTSNVDEIDYRTASDRFHDRHLALVYFDKKHTVYTPAYKPSPTQGWTNKIMGCYLLTLGGRREFENLISLKV